MSFEYDDISKSKFKKNIETDPGHENLLMKYFGNKVDSSSEDEGYASSTPHHRESFRQRLKIVKPVIITCMLAGIAFFAQNERLVSMLSFTEKPFVNTAIYFGAIFLVIFIIVMVTYNI